MFSPDPTHQPTQAPTHPPTIHPPMGGEFFTDFKSSNGIEISWLVQVLSNFNWFRGSPLGGWRMDGWGWKSVWVCARCPMYACMHMHVHAHTHMHVKHAKHGCLHAGGHLQFYTCVCVCVCVRAHMCACMWGHPPCPQISPDAPHPPAPSPEPQGAQNTKFQ